VITIRPLGGQPSAGLSASHRAYFVVSITINARAKAYAPASQHFQALQANLFYFKSLNSKPYYGPLLKPKNLITTLILNQISQKLDVSW
jgi:hypothetical protein